MKKKFVDIIKGTDGDDYLIGTQEKDILQGGLGADTLVGGEKKDIYLLAESKPARDIIVIGSGESQADHNDIIIDFDLETDKLDFGTTIIPPNGLVDGVDTGHIDSHLIEDGNIIFYKTNGKEVNNLQKILDYLNVNLGTNETVVFGDKTDSYIIQKESTNDLTVVRLKDTLMNDRALNTLFLGVTGTFTYSSTWTNQLFTPFADTVTFHLHASETGADLSNLEATIDALAGNDLIAMTLTDSSAIHNNSFNINLNEGSDTLTIDFDFLVATLDNSFYSNATTIDGGDGSDTLTFDFDNNGHLLKANVRDNSITLNGGGNDDNMTVNWHLGSQRNGSGFYSNTIALNGDDGHDDIALHITASGLTGNGIHHNSLSLNGGNGDDTLNISFQLTNLDESIGFSRNTIDMLGGTGDDSIDFNLLVKGNYSGDIQNNAFNMDGGDGDDLISFAINLTGLNNDFYNNTISLTGGLDNDTISIDISLDDSYWQNHVSLNGGAGSDSISFSGNLAYQHTSHIAFYYDQLGDGSDTISITGSGLNASNAKNAMEFRFNNDNFLGDGNNNGSLDDSNLFSTSSNGVAKYIYDPATYKLSYDEDADGTELVLIATFDVNVNLTAADILFY